MRAVVTPARGAIRIDQVDIPTPAPEEVVLRVEWATISPVDSQTVQGMYSDLGWISQQGPVGLGWEAAGVVARVGDAVTSIRPGQRVVALSAGVDKPLGALADFLVVSAEAVAVLPDAVSTKDAVTLPLNVLTAMQALDLLGKADGGRLLVTGAAGSVGGFCLTLATQRGWNVLALARPTDKGFVTRAGAKLITRMEGIQVDAVLDAAALDVEALDVVVDGGRYVGVFPPTIPAPRRGISTTAVAAVANHEQLQAAVELLAFGEIEARHASHWPLEDVAQAFTAAEQHGVRGRVLVQP